VGAEAQVTHGSPGATPGQKAGAGAVEERDGLGAVPSWEARAEATEICDSPEATPSQKTKSIILIWGVPSTALQTSDEEWNENELFSDLCKEKAACTSQHALEYF
jgi:hypothetical protein